MAELQDKAPSGREEEALWATVSRPGPPGSLSLPGCVASGNSASLWTQESSPAVGGHLSGLII